MRVWLGTDDYEQTPDSVWLTTASNGYQKQGATLMSERGEAFVGSVPAEADTLAYQVVGVRKSLLPTISGTDADRYVFNESGPFWDTESDYVAVVDGLAETPAAVTFEPGQLPPPSREPVVRSDNPTVEGIVSIYRKTEAMERRLGERSQTFRPLLQTVRTDEEREALRDSVQQAMEQFADSLKAPIRRRIAGSSSDLALLVVRGVEPGRSFQPYCHARPAGERARVGDLLHGRGHRNPPRPGRAPAVSLPGDPHDR